MILTDYQHIWLVKRPWPREKGLFACLLDDLDRHSCVATLLCLPDRPSQPKVPHDSQCLLLGCFCSVYGSVQQHGVSHRHVGFQTSFTSSEAPLIAQALSSWSIRSGKHTLVL